MASKRAYAEMVGKFENLMKAGKKTRISRPKKKKIKPVEKKNWLTTLRDNLATEDKKRQLRRSLSEADIRRLQGKKKNNPKKRGGY